MTLQRIFPLALLLAILPFAACDDGDPTGNGACDSGTLTATVDGQAFTAECIVIDVANGVLSISGIANFDGSAGANQQTIMIGGAQAQTGMQNPIVATYSDTDVSNPTGGLNCSASGIPGTPAPSLTVSTLDGNSASGTFSFTALCPSTGTNVRVTNGRFDISG